MDEGLQKYITDRVDVSDSGCWEWIHQLNAKGYGYLGTTKYSKLYRKAYAHQLGYIAFKGVYDSKLYICHKCDNPKCCNPHHLYAGTQKDNMRDRDLAGRGRKGVRQNVGSKNGAAKLDEEDVAIIRNLQGKLLQRQIANIFNVSRTMISHIHRNINWLTYDFHRGNDEKTK